jgi:GT2 family glycosyltransferase
MTDKKIKVYFALLNNGPIRREMSTIVIPAMQKTPGVELVWENPSVTWANPISSNRNKIVKRFLETDCDYLLMIDDDVVPYHNPCELVFAGGNTDVIGCPALVRASGQTIVWTAYIPHSDGIGYSAVDLDSFDDMFDLLEVAIVGTGCILIKRAVLEKVREPFHSEFDEDGIQTYGTDFAFCRRATKAGFHVYTTVHRRCEHFKTVGLNDFDAWDSINYFCSDNAKFGIPWGEYSITQKDWNFIKAIIKGLGVEKILEFGCGLSSLLLSELCEVISYETDNEWKEKIESKVLPQNNLTVKLWDGVNFPRDLIKVDAKQGVKTPKFDLCFVDGPKEIRKGGAGRNMSIHIASKLSDHVIVHDAGRPDEEKFQRAHLRSVFKLERKSGNHMTRCNYWKRRPHPVTLEEIKAKMKSSNINN